MNFLKFLRISTVFFVICNLQFAINVYCDVPTAQFLLVGQGARAEAMGQSVVSNCFDYTSLYWNPSASAFLYRPEAGFNLTELPAEIISSYIAFIYPYKKFAFGIRILGETTEVPSFDVSENRLADVKEDNGNFNLVFAYRIFDSLALGIGIGPVSMQLANFKADAPNINLGAIYKKDRISAGLAFANLGGPLSFVQPGQPKGQEEAQPTLLRAGITYSFLDNKNLLVSGSLENVFSDKMAGGLRLGAEYFIVKNLALRGGFKGGSEGPLPSLGFGLRFGQFVLDYSLSLALPKLKDTQTQRIGFSIKFGKEKEEIVEIKKPVVPVEKPVIKPTKMMNIAVADLDAHNVSAMEAATIADFIRAELINSGVFVVLERSNMAKVLAEQKFQQTGCTTTECAVQMGKILNVEKMIVGSFSKMMNIFYISARLVDVETGTALLAETVSCPVDGDLYAKVKELVEKIVNRVTQQ